MLSNEYIIMDGLLFINLVNHKLVRLLFKGWPCKIGSFNILSLKCILNKAGACKSETCKKGYLSEDLAKRIIERLALNWIFKIV